MLNLNVKKEALHRLETEVNRHKEVAKQTSEAATALFNLRCSSSEVVTRSVESYVNQLANSPKEFDHTVSEFKVSIERFDHIISSIKQEAERADMTSGSMGGVGIGLGAAAAAFGPSAAMVAATTFGTASTGTAISMLSGAAATNAALAWLGGGAIAAGGGGMVAGQAILALAGPIGWGIGAVALTGTAVWAHGKNKGIAEKATVEAGRVLAQTRSLQTAQTEIHRITGLTNEHAAGAMNQLNWLRQHAPSNYQEFTPQAKQELASLINNIRSLSTLLNQQIA